MAESMFHNRPTGRPPQQCRRNTSRRGFTLFEFAVAMGVFGVAMMGLFPLLVMQSRNLQPVRSVDPNLGTVTYKSLSPARDWNNTDDTLPVMMRRHTWYLTPYDDPWVRKLGASARLFPSTTSGLPASEFTLSTSPIPVQPSFVFLDDNESDDVAILNDAIDGCGTYTALYWTPDATGGFKDDYHYHAVPTDQSDPSLDDLAEWTITVSADGWYSIQATWPIGTGKSLANATYEVTTLPSHPVTPLPTNQASPGNGVTDNDGITWWPLTTLTQLNAGDVVTVTLHVPPNVDQPDLYVIADGVRIVQNEVKIISIDRSLGGANSNSNGADLTVHVSITVNLSQ